MNFALDKDVIASAKLSDASDSASIQHSTSPSGRPILSSQKKSAFKPASPSKSSLEERLFSDVPQQALSRRNSTTFLEDPKLAKAVRASRPASPTTIAVPQKKSQKEMTKAERRALQEKQRAEKAQRQAASSADQQKRKDSKNPEKPQLSQKSTTNANLNQIKATKPKKKQKESLQSGSLFTHLNQYDLDRIEVIQKKAQLSQVHPIVLALGLRYANFEIAGGNSRCLAMLTAFKRVIQEYNTPSGITLQRHLTSHISKQIDFLNTTRPLATTMKHAIRFVKNEIATLSLDLPDEDAKEFLINRIEEYIRQKIVFSMQVIKTSTIKKIQSGDCLLVYGFSSTVLQVLEHAKEKGIDFTVVVVDSRPKFEGKRMLKRLVDLGIECEYIIVNAIGVLMKQVTKVLLGASCVLSNGAIMSRAGTALVAMIAHENKVPVIVCAESYKFSETVRLDSFVWNEIGDPFEVSSIPRNESIIADWQSNDKLSVLNLYYDVTPSQYITMVVCEHGFIASTSVPTVLREVSQA